LGEKGEPDYHRNAILQLNPARLDEPVEVEAGPSTQIELRPSETEKDKEELWIKITTPSLDDALRFGELHTQNHAYRNGWSFIHHSDPNLRFNGKVHFQYSGSDQGICDVKEKLSIMEKRFAEWQDDFGLYAGDNSERPCTLTVEYME
ncbi:MAG: hypothetical protein COA42_17635, partial [Alteromonadaceae bacterium]